MEADIMAEVKNLAVVQEKEEEEERARVEEGELRPEAGALGT